MYKITFKGKDIEPVFVEDEKGKQVWDIWLQNKTARIVVNNSAFSTSDIKNISLMEKTRAEIYKPETTQQNADYDSFRKKMLSLSIEQRAQILRIPKLVWESSTNEIMTDEVKEKIKARQLAYFKENPNCIYTNPHAYQDLIPRNNFAPSFDGVKKISNLVGASMLGLISNAIATDLQYAQTEARTS